MAERPELRLVREHLETVVSPSMAASVLFEALGAGSMPRSATETEALVAGPLRSALKERMRPGEADSLIDDVLTALAPALAAQPEHRDRADDTLEVPVSSSGQAVRLAIMSSSDAFAQNIEAALGPARVSAVTFRSAVALRRALEVILTTPDVVVVDASRFPAIEPSELASTFQALADTAVRVVWGADLPYGSALMREVRARAGKATSVDRGEGIGPILDLIGSRSGRPTLPP